MKGTYDEGYKAAYREWIEELNRVMPQDYKDWWQNSDREKPLVARLIIESLIRREDIAWDLIEQLEGRKGTQI